MVTSETSGQQRNEARRGWNKGNGRKGESRSLKGEENVLMNRASRLFSINEIFPSPFPALLQTQTTSSRDADKSTRTRLDPEPGMRRGG